MATILAHHLPPPPHAHSTSQSGEPPLLLQITPNNSRNQPVIVIHSHPTTIHLFTNNALQSAWSFPHPIVSYSYSCSSSNSSNDNTKQRLQQHQEHVDHGIVLIVATQDGSIWNVPLPVTNTTSNSNNSSNQRGGASTSYHAAIPTLGRGGKQPPSSPEIAIKIEDEDEEEEVELWNDEDGLVVDQDFDALDSLLPPANKRQRTASPPPTTTTTSHGTAPDSSGKVQYVNNAQHLIGSETNVSHIAFVSGDLLIFRYGEGLVHWTSSHQFAPHTDITRQVVPKAQKSLQAVARISEYPIHRTQDGQAATLFVETRASVIYRISISVGGNVTIQELFNAKEPIAALLAIPSKTPGQGQSLLVVGSKGAMSWNETQLDRDGTPVASAPKTLALDTDIKSAFVADAHVYVLTGKGRVLRLPVASLGRADRKDQEIMDLPPLCAMSPILSDDDIKTVVGLYGFNQQGQLLKFPADWIQHAKTRGVVDARESVGRALSELERLSDQVKQLEIQCQLENQRIATYNRLVFELQQAVMAASSTGSSRQDIIGTGGGDDVDMESGLLIEASLSTFSHVVSDGCEGTKRFYARLRIKSRANIDWSRGWSVGVNVASKVEFCPHGKPTPIAPVVSQQHNNAEGKKENRIHYQTYASLRTLTRQIPWTLDIELDRAMVSSLPLQVSIGLLFREVGLSHQQSKSSGDVQEGGEGFAAYFVVDSLDLDVLDFVEGAEDPLRRDEPTFVQRCPPPATGIASNSKDKDENGDDDEVEECMQCKVEKGSTSGTDAGAGAIEAASAFRPIEFEIDTTFITIPQCLPALIYDPCDSDNYGHGSHRAIKIVDMMSIAGKKQQQERLGMPEASFRACFVVPDECLSSFAGRSNLVPLIRPNAQQQQQRRRRQGLQGQGHRNSLFGTDAVMGGRSFRNSTWGSGAAAGIGGQIEDPDLRLIWVDLEVPSTGRGRHGQQDQQGQERDRGVKAQVLVRGSDLERVFVVRQALERRIHALF